MNSLESLLRKLAMSGVLTESKLRYFACACCRRILPLCTHPMCRRLLDFAQSRASGTYSHSELEALRAEAVPIYDSLYPGHGAPSAKALAFSAFGEPAFTDDPVTAAINASSTAAEAKGVASAEGASTEQFDALHDSAYDKERDAQLLLLHEMVGDAST